jgi:signal transduction histidine kinase
MQTANGDGAREAAPGVRHWRHAFAATLLLLTGLLFLATSWFNSVALPGWLWFVLVLIAAAALAARPEGAVSAPQDENQFSHQPAAAQTESGTPSPQIILAATTHELRTPLNAIVGFSELLRDSERTGASKKQREDFACAILENAHHLQQRLNDVLDANRLTSGAMKISSQPFDFAEIIEVVSRERHAAAEARGVTVLARIADGISCSGDGFRLRQALAAIVDNAIAFSPSDGIININMLRGSGGQLVVSVTDAGPGISPANVERAFEPFRQVDEGAARHHAGIGLGLFIARGIMRLHGGDVTLTSSPESGTDVRLVLPASRVDWAAARQKPALVAVANVA